MSRASGTDGPEDVDATFAKIVAGLKAEGFGTDTDDHLIDADPSDDDTGDRRQARLRSPREHDTARSGWRTPETDWEDTLLGDDPTDDDEHFVPPSRPRCPGLARARSSCCCSSWWVFCCSSDPGSSG